MMSYGNLTLYYKTIFNLVTIHDYVLSDVENMIPYERDLYIDLLINTIKENKTKTR